MENRVALPVLYSLAVSLRMTDILAKRNFLSFPLANDFYSRLSLDYGIFQGLGETVRPVAGKSCTLYKLTDPALIVKSGATIRQ
jgi:hypothetical protein